MNNSAIIPTNYIAQRMGARILEALCRLGFEHHNQDGRIFHPTFSDIVVYGDRWAVFEIDAQRLWHFSVTDLSSAKVIEQLSAVLHKPVKVLKRNGLYYVVELCPPPTTRLPHRVDLDLDHRPAGELLVPLGRGRAGDVWQSLPDLGHTLIIGATGSGKSTWLHCALAALLTTTTPETLQVALVDPKQLELSQWAHAPHLRGRVACDVQTAADLLDDLMLEMDQRGARLAGLGARDLAGYNRRADQPLPYILCIIDECLDLTLQAGAKSELVGLLKRLASKGRATGISLWLSATHGTADILPRVVTVNLATRIVFRVQDSHAAQMAGCPGAQRLPRDCPGRMLVKWNGEPQELQGYWLSDDRLAALTGHWAATGAESPSKTTWPQNLMDLVTWAVTENNGYLTLSDMQRVGQLGQREARRLAARWERKGWLAKDKHNRRSVTPALRQMAGLD